MCILYINKYLNKTYKILLYITLLNRLDAHSIMVKIYIL